MSRIACIRNVFRGCGRRVCRHPEYVFLGLLEDLSMKCPVSSSSLKHSGQIAKSAFFIFSFLTCSGYVPVSHDSGHYTGSDYLPGVLYLRYYWMWLFVPEVFAIGMSGLTCLGQFR